MKKFKNTIIHFLFMGLIKDFDWIVRKGFLRRFDKLGNNPVFIVDTGTIIDLSKTYNNYTPAIIEIIEREYPLIITRGVLKEVEKHSMCRLNHGREISFLTLKLIRELQEKTEDILKEAEIDSLNIDSFKYAVYWAAKDSFRDDYRKKVKDEISDIDKEIIVTALFLSRSKYKGVPISSANILSPDSHIKKTVETLKSPKFGYTGIKVIPTRGDIRSYLRK